MHEEYEAEIRGLLESDNKILAIKRYREVTGVGLAEAKAAVESLEAGRSLIEPLMPDNSDLKHEIVNLLGRGEYIEAIKQYRQRTNVGLKEAKEAVDRIGEQNGIPTSSGTGCLGVILLGIAVVGGLLN